LDAGKIRRRLEQIAPLMKKHSQVTGHCTYRGYLFRWIQKVNIPDEFDFFRSHGAAGIRGDLFGELLGYNIRAPIVADNVESAGRIGPAVPVMWTVTVHFDKHGDPHYRVRKRVVKTVIDLPMVQCPVCLRFFFRCHGNQRICDECKPEWIKARKRKWWKRHTRRNS